VGIELHLVAADRCPVGAVRLANGTDWRDKGGCVFKTLQHPFDRNRAWAEGIKGEDREFFSRLCRQQAPEYLWIGCSDSRVPANLDPEQKTDAVSELNVIEQVTNVCNTTIVNNAWQTGEGLSVHGWIHGTEDGTLKGLVGGVSECGELEPRLRHALQAV